jgi:hypothetical protein
MKQEQTESGAPDAACLPKAGNEEPTGLPWPRTWPGVYWVVAGSFVLYVLLLALLTARFS